MLRHRMAGVPAVRPRQPPGADTGTAGRRRCPARRQRVPASSTRRRSIPHQPLGPHAATTQPMNSPRPNRATKISAPNHASRRRGVTTIWLRSVLLCYGAGLQDISTLRSVTNDVESTTVRDAISAPLPAHEPRRVGCARSLDATPAPFATPSSSSASSARSGTSSSRTSGRGNSSASMPVPTGP